MPSNTPSLFMSISPRSHQYMNFSAGSMRLRIVMDDGVAYKPDIKITQTKVDQGKSFFKNNSGNNDSFTVTALFHKDDTDAITQYWTENWQTIYEEDGFDYVVDEIGLGAVLGKRVSSMMLIDYYIRKGEPFYVDTRAVGIDGTALYLVTEQSSRKQANDAGWVTWDLTFTKADAVFNQSIFKNTNTVVNQAVKNYKSKVATNKKKKTAKKKAAAKTKTSVKDKWKKCDYRKIKYSKTKKVVPCVKHMQEILYKKGFYKKTNVNQIDGWYGNQTREALKKFQKKYKKKYKCKTDGNLDKNTHKALYSV